MSWKDSGVDSRIDFDVDLPIKRIPKQTVVQEGLMRNIENTHKPTDPSEMATLTKLEARLKLKGLKYDIDTETVEIKDDKGNIKKVKLYIFDIRSMTKRMKEIDEKLKDPNLSKRDAKKLTTEKKIMRENIAFVRSTGPFEASGNIYLSSEEISRMSRADLEGTILHEGEHTNQETRKEGAQAEKGLLVIDNEELEFIKDYLKTENGSNLGKTHDALLIELTADAAAVKQQGAAKYTKGLRNDLNAFLSYKNIGSVMKETFTSLDADFIRAQELLDQAENNGSDSISDKEMYDLFERTSSSYDGALRALAKLKEVLQDDEERTSLFGLAVKLVKAFVTPDKYFNKKMCKELVKKLAPNERKEAIRYIFNKKSEDIMGKIINEIDSGKFNREYEKIYESNLRLLEARIQFCKDFEKWYKHVYKKTVVEFLELTMNDMGIYCEAYLAEHFAERMFEETHKEEIIEENGQECGTEPPARKPGAPAQPNPMPPVTTTTEAVAQEGVFADGFNNLRSRLAKALGDKYTITNVFTGMGGTQEFHIKNDETDTKVESRGNGCRVTTRSEDGSFKLNFGNIALSMALDKILELFTQPALLTEGAVYTESDDDEKKTDDDEDLDTLLNDMESEGADRESPQDDADEDADKKEEAELEEIDISAFGSDSSDVQNQYDPKEIDTLNKLIAAESEAINDYFDASKDSHDENLMRLYSDIGHEERFHLEQLLYAKSTLTGEKYEPRDPEVKKEFDDLIAIGMDSDTAASTAIDKVTMKPDVDDMDELVDESWYLFNSIFQNSILMELGYDAATHDTDNEMIMEAFFQEEMSNLASAPKEIRKIQSPVKILIKGLKVSINGVLRLGNIIRDSVVRSKYGAYQMHEWIKKHGIGALFAGGISLYFYNDKISRYDFSTPMRYVDMLYNLTKAIAKETGIHLTAEAKHDPVKDPIRFGNVLEGMDKLRQVSLTKTKVIVNDNNKDMLAREFFGYNEAKLTVKVNTEEGAMNQSYNIFNRLNLMEKITAEYMKISLAVLEALDRMEGDTNTIFYKDRNKYNKAVKNMKIIVGRYNEYIKCMAYDTNQILKLNNGLRELTEKHDASDSKGEKFEGKNIHTSNGLTSPVDNRYTKPSKM